VWHERAGFVDGDFTRHFSNCQMAFDSQVVVGSYNSGDVYALDMTKYTDNGVAQKWLRSWRALPTGQNNLKRTTQHSLQLDIEAGVGLVEPAAEVIEELILCENEDELLTEDFQPLASSLTFPEGSLYAWEEVQLRCEDNTELLTEAGQEIIISAGYVVTIPPPQVMLRWSDDGGHDWSNEHWVSIGRIGEYGTRAIWRRLGMTLALRDRVYEVSGANPVKIAIMGAELVLSPTNS